MFSDLVYAVVKLCQTPQIPRETPLSPTDRFDILLEEFRYCWQRCWLPS